MLTTERILQLIANYDLEQQRIAAHFVKANGTKGASKPYISGLLNNGEKMTPVAYKSLMNAIKEAHKEKVRNDRKESQTNQEE